MDITVVKSLHSGGLIYHVDDMGGRPRVIEWSLVTDCQGGEKLSKHIRIRRTRPHGGSDAVRRVSLSDLAEFGRTPGEAAELYIQAKVRDEMREQAALQIASEARNAARVWFVEWYAADRKVG